MSLAEWVRQISILLSLPAVVLMGAAAAAIVVVRDWRIVLFSYGLLSVVLAMVMAQTIPTEWALLQTIVGGMNAVMLYLSARQLRGARIAGAGREGHWPQLASLTSFRLLALVLAMVAFLAIHDWIALPVVGTLTRDAIVWLAMMGTVGVALHEEPLHAGLALLMILGSFLLLLFALSHSRMLVGLMESWQLLLGLAISYLTVSRGLAGTEPDPSQPAYRGRL